MGLPVVSKENDNLNVWNKFLKDHVLRLHAHTAIYVAICFLTEIRTFP